MQGFIYFVKYAFKKQKGFLAMNLLKTLLNALSPVLLIYIPKFIIDAAIGGDQRRAVAYAIVYVAAYLLLNTCISWIQYGAGIHGSKLFKAFQMDMAEKLLDADLDDLESNAFKERSERAKKYIFADGYGFGYIFESALEVIQLCVTALSYIFIILNFSPLLVLINLVFTIISFKVGANIKKREKQDQDARIKHERGTTYYTNIASDHTYLKDIRIFSYKPSLLRKMAYHYDANTKFYAKINRRHAFSEMLSNSFYAIQLGIGYAFIIALLISKSITVGDFTLYVSALTMYASLMGRILEKAVYVRSYDMYFNDFKDYMNIENMKGRSDVKVDRAEPVSIEFKNVSFRYAGSETHALKNVNIKISDGDRIAIVGENGGGKTTFIKLLMRLYDPTEGQILVNGVDIREYSYEDYIGIFSAVFQDYSLFATTIGENITMDDQVKVDEKFAAELSEIGLLTKAILSYSKHFDTSVYKIFDDQGIEPSGGEGQQIAIARSLHKEAKINILDEPTAALDPKIEYEIYQKYDAITRKNLSFFVSHRLGSCKFANRILVFSGGQIIEDGSHSELLRKNGAYSELYNYQASMYSAAGVE
jgi:ATP-binding cassette subfamily B protein/ATP-binding cassette subfamily C protein